MIKKTMISLLIIISFFNMLHSEQAIDSAIISGLINTKNIGRESLRKFKNKSIKTINFVPEKEFGGNLAQGQYNPKKQTAIILHGTKEYLFTKTTSHPTNPWIPDKKNLDPDMVLIGSYNTIKTKKPEMPVTTYIFGVLEHTSLPKVDDALVPVLMGSNPATYAPTTFQPSEQFAGNGLIGNYFRHGKIATIHDPSGTNKQGYTFENVQEGGMQTPDELILIGSYSSQPQSNGIVASHAIRMINLYGTIKPKTE